jgi:hypothetical protein
MIPPILRGPIAKAPQDSEEEGASTHVLGEEYPNRNSEEENQNILERIITCGLQLSLENGARLAASLRGRVGISNNINHTSANRLIGLLTRRLVEMVRENPSHFIETRSNCVIITDMASAYFFMYVLATGNLPRLRVSENLAIQEASHSVTVCEENFIVPTPRSREEIIQVIVDKNLQDNLPPYLGVMVGVIASMAQHIFNKKKEEDKKITK